MKLTINDGSAQYVSILASYSSELARTVRPLLSVMLLPLMLFNTWCFLVFLTCQNVCREKRSIVEKVQICVFFTPLLWKSEQAAVEHRKWQMIIGAFWLAWWGGGG